MTTNPNQGSRVLPFKGLSPEEVSQSRQNHGSNVVTPPERDPLWKQFLEKFEDPVIRILLVAALLAIVAGFFHGDFTEGAGIVMAILLATTLAFYNEYRASKEFDILNQSKDETPVKVIRSGSFTTIPRREVVVGDVVLLETGDEVPADGKILEAVSLFIDEAKLTGESHPSPKISDENPPNTSQTTYPSNVALKATIAVEGHGIMVITAVGDSSEFGKSAREAEELTGEKTPLNEQLETLGKKIGVVGFLVAAITFSALLARSSLNGEIQNTIPQWFSLFTVLIGSLIVLIRIWLPIIYDAAEWVGYEWSENSWLEQEGLWPWVQAFISAIIFFLLSLVLGYGIGFLTGPIFNLVAPDVWRHILSFFMIAVTIIVVAVPEGLAMSVTLSLAYSMRKLTAANNLVRKLHACETIGAATVICSDKTGTLTQNSMMVQDCSLASEISPELIQKSAVALRIVEGISSNSTANIGSDTNGNSIILGNKTEGAILQWLQSKNIDYLSFRQKFKILKQLPFSTERKFMATLGNSDSENKAIIYIKGAPEVVLALCSNAFESQKLNNSEILASLVNFQKRGMRTIAFAFRLLASNPQDDLLPLCQDMIWLGFVALADPIRPDVPAALASCCHAGVLLKVVTGDVKETAIEISRQIGLVGSLEDAEKFHLSGPEFALLDDSTAAKRVEEIRVLSRARPLDKRRLVHLLKENGHVVAVTGDGTNDAGDLACRLISRKLRFL